MKRAKFILAAVAILAIAGGSLAFKAANRGSVDYFTTSVFNAIPGSGNVVHNGQPQSGSDGRVYWTLSPSANATAYSIIAAEL